MSSAKLFVHYPILSCVRYFLLNSMHNFIYLASVSMFLPYIQYILYVFDGSFLTPSYYCHRPIRLSVPRFLLEWEQEEKKCWNWINSNNFFFFLNICVYFYFGLRQCILISMFGFPIWHDLHSENMCVVSIADHVCVRVCEWLALDLNESRQLLYSIVYELPTTRRIWILCYFCFPYEWIKYQNDSIDSATFATFQKYVCAILRLPLSPI